MPCKAWEGLPVWVISGGVAQLNGLLRLYLDPSMFQCNPNRGLAPSISSSPSTTIFTLSTPHTHNSISLVVEKRQLPALIRFDASLYNPEPRMAPTTPTILALKQNFLTAQTRLLSQPLQPSRAWRRGNEAAADDENDQRLSERAVDDALFRLNHTLQQHAKRVYAPQATRHVAEQIEGLYLAIGERRVGEQEGGDVDDADAWKSAGTDYGEPRNRQHTQFCPSLPFLVLLGSDMTITKLKTKNAYCVANAEIISSLPPTWDSEREAAARPLEAKRYAELVERLQGLSARKAEADARVKRLRKMKALLEPFNTEGSAANPDASAGDGSSSLVASNSVQENLVTRDGEVEKELERMRMLLVRVGDKVAKLKEREGSADDEDDLFGEGEAMIVDDVEVEERRKVDGLLDQMS